MSEKFLGKPNGRKGVPILPVSIMDVADLYQTGMSQNEIAKKFGVHPSQVRWRLKQAGVKPRSQGARVGNTRAQRSDVKSGDLVSLYEKGLSSVALARLYGLSRAAVTARLRKAGVSMRPSRRPQRQQAPQST